MKKRRVFIALVLLAAVAMLVVQGTAQTPEIEKNMARLAELRDQMSSASPDQYEQLKAEYDSLSTATEAQVKAYNADKEANARAVSLYNQGNDALRRRRFSEAVGYFKQSIQLNGMEPRAHYSLGMALQFERKYDDALAAFDKASKIDPSYLKAYYAQGVLLGRMGRLDEALKMYREAIQVENADPKDLAEAYAGMGSIYFRQKKFDDAIRAYEKSTAINPEYAESWYNLGKTYSEKKDFKSAVDATQKAVGLEPRNYKYLTALAEKYNRLGDYSHATTAAQAATGINSNYAPAWFELGWALENLDKKNEAISAYEKAMNDRAYRQSAEYQIKLLKGEF